MKSLRLHQVLRLRGLPGSTLLESAAERRCRQCPRASLCDESLATGRFDALRLFCPNAHYIEALRSRCLEFN